MKRFAVASVLLCVCIAVCALCTQAVDRRLDALCSAMGVLLDSLNENPQDAMQTLQAEWKRSETALHMLLTHRTMDELERSLLLLPEQMNGDPALFRESCRRVRLLLENLLDAERVSLKNIF